MNQLGEAEVKRQTALFKYTHLLCAGQGKRGEVMRVAWNTCVALASLE